MRFIKEIRGIKALLSCGLLLTSGACLAPMGARAQQGSPSTVELESQSNTNNYPGLNRRRFSPQPSNTQPSNPDPPANTPAPNNTVPADQNTPPPSSARAPVAPAASPTTGVAQANPGAPQTALPQTPTFIGPPWLPPPTLEQMAPGAPKVDYANGLLTVESVNARLTDILAAIRSKAGIQFEGISSAPERVAGKFGPAPAGDVLASLLAGLHFDYVIIGMPDHPSLVQKVIVNPNAGSATVATNSADRPAQQTSNDQDEDSDDSSAEEQSAQPHEMTPPKSVEQLKQELEEMSRRNKAQNEQQQSQPSQPPVPH